MAKNARKPRVDQTEEVFRSAAPGVSQEGVDELLKNLKRRAPGAPPSSTLRLATEEISRPMIDAPRGMPSVPKKLDKKAIVRDAISKAKEDDSRLKDAKVRAGDKSDNVTKIALGLGALVAAGLALHLYVSQPKAVARANLSAEVVDLLPMTELHDHGGEWIGVVDAGWVGVSDKGIAEEACDEVRARMLIPAGLTLYSTQGLKVITCF